MSEWIDIKDKFPEFRKEPWDHSYVLAYHTIHGVGVAWFWRFEDDGIKEELEEDFKDKYLCSCQFIKNKPDGNACIDDDDDIDIFQNSPYFTNLGTVTHWMPLPKSPKEEVLEELTRQAQELDMGY